MRKRARDRLILFTRYPEPGKTKTRLISALGEEGAAELQQEMVLHTLRMAEHLARRRPISIEVHFEGGNKRRMAALFGTNIRYVRQCGSDLGERMLRSFRMAFRKGMKRVIIVGTDCPGITVEGMEQAFDALEHSPLVLGPAKDGGYYLIGMRKAIPPLFEDIPWGTGEVLTRTLEVTEDMDLPTTFLELLDDVDRPEDLHVWEATAGHMPDGEHVPRISVVIPTLNEAEHILKTLARVQSASGVEVVVIDGGSNDQTVRLAQGFGAKVIVSAPGRARQMNAGADEGTGDILLFLHADTRLPQRFDYHIRQVLADPETVGGAFRLRTDVDSLGLRVIEELANWRSRRLQMPYGDQGIFVRADLFRTMGGFPDMPIMEDFEFMRRLKRQYGRVVTVPVPVITSSRRWRSLGILRTTLVNQVVIMSYLAGVPPSRLARWYQKRWTGGGQT